MASTKSRTGKSSESSESVGSTGSTQPAGATSTSRETDTSAGTSGDGRANDGKNGSTGQAPVVDTALRLPAEAKYADELAFLATLDGGPRPFTWRLSPRMVRTFILGSTPADKISRPIPQKFFGDPALVERAIVTLASDRGLLLIGDPGTGKSWLAELLAAAICSNSTLVVQGTAGTTEDQLKYSWNVAMVIASGQSPESIIPSPIMIAMQRGDLGRIEELTRCTSDVQDALISILSEKYISIPELKGDSAVFARPGFNIIATANSRDRGVNDLSTALKRRFNFVSIPTVTNKKSEKEIVLFRTKELLSRSSIEIDLPPALLDILLQTFADLRDASAAATSDDQRLESSLSTAEQIGVLEDAVLHSRFFGDSSLQAHTLASSLVGGLVRRIPEDVTVLNKFWHAVVEKRADKSEWGDFAEGGKRALGSMKLDVMSSPLDAIRQQLREAAEAFSSDALPLASMLGAMVDDLERASREPLVIFPVCHHSPASAVHMVRRLREVPPKIIFMEGCEDMRALLPQLADCRLPVALQAFSLTSGAFPSKWMPLNCIAPITEFSAEYQAIAYAMQHPEVELHFVDRSTDHVFQWMPQEDEAFAERSIDGAEPATDEETGGTAKPAISPGSAIAVQVGSLEPTFEQFEAFLLRNARVHHFQEWWEQYVEQAVLGADFATYREVMFLVGSLLRRLGRRKIDVESDRRRERYMWTRIKEKLAEKKLEASDALYVCGAIHGVSDVEEFGTHTDLRATIPPRTDTTWLYGLIPSSHASIERQFGHPPGTVSIAEATWLKAMQALKLKPFRIPRPKDATTTASPLEIAETSPASPASPTSPGTATIDLADIPITAGLSAFLSRPPALVVQDDEQLLRWCIEIVALARKNGYLASTADAIAVYQTTRLLASLRSRQHPTPYDFQDAAITCIEKDRVPGKRDVRRLCEILLGGDRLGMVGYASLPRLAQDVYDRLAPLSLKMTTTIERALMDFKRRPELLACSDLLWTLHYLLGDIARPIMGERKLGEVPIQESWDLSIGRQQRLLVELAYEGVVIEHVLEKRLKTKVNAPTATTTTALSACEDSLLYLKSPRLTEELGDRALILLEQETSAKDAPEVFDRVRRLVAYYRSTRTGLPPWIKRFVVAGYSHYTSLLPEAFADQGTRPEQIAAMLAFLFTLEGLALSLGCSRSQLVIAIGQAAAGTEDATKTGLLWAAEWLLGLREVGQIRAYLDQVLINPLMLPAFPGYVSGFLLALTFTPLVARLVVELLSKAFERLPDEVMMPWLPALILMLRPHAHDLLPGLAKEASQCFPADLAHLKSDWQAPWEVPDESTEPAPSHDPSQPSTDTPAPSGATSAGTIPALDLDPAHAAARALMFEHRSAIDGLAARLGLRDPWMDPSAMAASPSASTPDASTIGAPGKTAATAASSAAPPSPTASLLREYPATMEAVAKLV